ncbi:hypothetical protein Tco_0948355, partial [Tanacetum coccineum]
TTPSAGRARGSPVPTPFHDDPYMLVRQAYLPTATDTESEPFKDTLKTEEPLLLPPRLEPSSPDYTPATPHTDKESEPSETSEIRVTSPHFTTPPSDLTSPPSPQQSSLTSDITYSYTSTSFLLP